MRENCSKNRLIRALRGISTYHVTGTCHFAQKIGTHNSVNSGGS